MTVVDWIDSALFMVLLPLVVFLSARMGYASNAKINSKTLRYQLLVVHRIAIFK